MSDPVRAGGYCKLIDRWIYDKYLLDETFEWWWFVTKLESQVLKEGLGIKAVANHEKWLHHYGGKSGKGYKDAKGMDVDVSDVIKWFDMKNAVDIIEEL